jgi:hypothetical protein
VTKNILVKEHPGKLLAFEVEPSLKLNGQKIFLVKDFAGKILAILIGHLGTLPGSNCQKTLLFQGFYKKIWLSEVAILISNPGDAKNTRK